MPYSHPTFAQAKSALKARLQDPAGVHWVDAEGGLYIQESLPFWNLAALYFRDRVTLSTVAGTEFYDLRTVHHGSGATRLAGNATDRPSVDLHQYALRASVHDFSARLLWRGTEMFTMDDLQSALPRRLNQFLFETRLIVQESSQDVASGNG